MSAAPASETHAATTATAETAASRTFDMLHLLVARQLLPTVGQVSRWKLRLRAFSTTVRPRIDGVPSAVEASGMRCPSCAQDLRPGARFCDACGRAVGGAGPAARPPAPPHLAEKILAARGRLEGERKQVTVLFADVKGSMELAGQVDAETWHRILDRFFAILADGVHRFEGTVNQFTGDGIMALFGAPLAHEDHARRACAAALHLRAEIGRY